ncbi:MAG: hypothetical protein J2P37_24095 [Ktedonobacteraceae bacterium]|nr:hypothetical protein [Ktedonobacteraceae bacterium]MBO0789868.1 hypothetical protein [Ktedonobacteraceae bacterium]
MQQQMQAMQQLPPEAHQMAMTYQLGTPLAEYRGGFTGRSIGGIILGIIFTGLFGAIAIGIMNDSSSSSSDGGPIIIMVVLALVGLCFLLWSIIAPIIYSSWRVYVCSDGFVFAKGSEVQPTRWEHVQAVWQSVTRHYRNGIYTGTTHKYTVERSDGYKVVFDDRFKKVSDLGDTLSNKATAIMLPRVLAAYNAGNVVNFGPLSVQLQGVSNGRELLPWSQISDFSVNQGIVSVRKEGKWLNWSSVEVAKIPNFFVFMALVRAILDGARGRQY